MYVCIKYGVGSPLLIPNIITFFNQLDPNQVTDERWFKVYDLYQSLHVSTSLVEALHFYSFVNNGKDGYHTHTHSLHKPSITAVSHLACPVYSNLPNWREKLGRGGTEDPQPSGLSCERWARPLLPFAAIFLAKSYASNTGTVNQNHTFQIFLTMAARDPWINL